MSPALICTILEIHPEQVIAITADGQRWSLPLSAILGKPVLNQPIFISAAMLESEAGAPHPLTHALIEHLLTPSS